MADEPQFDPSLPTKEVSLGDIPQDQGPTEEPRFDPSLPTRDLGSLKTQDNQWAGGLAGTAEANVKGQLHGMSDVFGAPVDLVNAGLSKIGVPVSDEPFLGSRSIRHMMDYPGKALGAASDYLFGNGTAQNLGLWGHATYDDINEVPETYRPQARLGEALGSGTAMAAMPLGAARVAGTTVPEAISAASKPSGSIAKDIWNSQAAEAVANPAAYMRGQSLASAGAGAGSWLAEEAFPGSPTAQVIGQLGGGLGAAGAGAGVSKAASGAARRIAEPLTTLTPAGQETAIARDLGEQFAKHGEDVEQVIKNLKAPEQVPGASLAERSGSKVLLGAQKNLANQDENLANVIAEKGDLYKQNLAQAFRSSFAPGSQSRLVEAATAESAKLDSMVTQAEQKASEALNPLQPVGPGERQALNVQARNILEGALSKARKTEDTLWKQVPKNLQVGTDNLQSAYKGVRDEMLPDARLPDLIQKTMNRIEKNPNDWRLKDMQNLRSTLLSQARLAGSQGDFQTRRWMNNLAQGALADMSSVGGNETYAARTFSAALHDRFTKTFAGDVLGLSDTGAPAVRPELTLESANTGSQAKVVQQLKEVLMASAPVNGGQPSPEMKQTIENYLRTLTGRLIDPVTGRLRTGTAGSFIRDNTDLLNTYPTLKAQLQRAFNAQMASDNVASDVRVAQKGIFSQLVAPQGKSPATVVGRIIDSENPQSFAALSQIAKNAGPDAVAGMRGSIMDWLMDKASSQSGLSYVKAQTILTNKMYHGDSLLDMMQKNGLVSPKQSNDILAKLNLGIRNELQQAVRIDKVGDEAGFWAQKFARILGAKLASHLGMLHGGAGESLQVAQIAASAAERQLAKMPVANARKILSEAFQAKDANRLISILEKVPGMSEKLGPLKTALRQPGLISTLRPLVPHEQSRAQMVGPGDVIGGPQ